MKQWEIEAAPRCWAGYRVVVLGDGETVNAALADAGKTLGHSFRPKEGKDANLLRVTIRRPDGSQFTVHPAKLRECFSPGDLEANKT